MAKDNEKKVSENMSSEELENVAGGWCMAGGKSAPKEVKSVKKNQNKDGSFSIVTTFKNGDTNTAMFDANGILIQGFGSSGDNDDFGAAPPIR